MTNPPGAIRKQTRMGNKANRNDYKSKPEQAKNHPIPGTRINKKARGFRVLFY